MPETVDDDHPEEIRTGADKLLELVKGSKEIAMAAAAKELGVPVQNVEAWANFLEEDGLVAIKYKFTTPYITTPEATEAKKEEEEGPGEDSEAGIKVELTKMLDILSKAGEEKLAGEFGMLKETYDTLISKIKNSHERLINDAKISPQKKVILNDFIRDLDLELRAASDDAAAGKFDQASVSYSKLYLKAKKAIDDVHSMYDQMILVQAIKETDDYKDILEKAYALMRDGKVTEAMELYEKLKFADENLAREFVAKKLQMEKDLAKFNKDLAKSIDRINLQKLNNVSSRITVLLNAGNQLLKKSEFRNAEEYYLAIKAEYEKLPPGFIVEKKELQRKILSFYSSLTTRRERAIKEGFDQSAKQVILLLKEIGELLKGNNVWEAVKAYREVKRLYSQLPEGFLKEKSTLQERILPLYTEMTSLYMQESLSRLKSMSSEITSQLSIMNRQIAKGELKEAEETYEKVKLRYREMPKGFLHEETALQNQIVQSYEEMLKKAKQMEEDKLTSTLSTLKKLLEQADALLKRKNYDECNDAYLKIINLYNTLPAGFTIQKSEVRGRILHLYQTLLHLTNEKEQGEMKVEQWEDAVKRKKFFAMDEISKLIMEVHKSVSAGNFQALQESMPRFDVLARIVPDLPRSNPALFSKLNDIKEETELFQSASSLEAYFGSGQVQQLKRSLDFIRKRKSALSQRCPEDKPLFDFVIRQYEAYLPKLISLASKEPLKSPVESVAPSQFPAQAEAEHPGTRAENLAGLEQEVDEIEKKIEDLKSLSRATVKLPQESQ